MLRKMFGAINRTMLPAGTAKGHLKMGKVTFDIALYMMVNERIDGVKEGEYLAVILEEVDDGLIKACKGLILFVFTRVVGTTAVKNITAAVTGFVKGYAAFKREGVNRY